VLVTRILFVGLAGLMLVPGMSPAVALAAGAALALTLGNPFPYLTRRGAPLLLKTSVVGLGFGMTLGMLARAGAMGVVATTTVVLGTLALGLWLGRVLRVPAETSLLIASGTGVCGGSAIAAVGAAVGARAEAMSAALATVFVLNAVALYVFPPAGGWVGLSENQFGVWAAVAIHDTSSVVGAAALYGTTALAVATIFKLARALWIVPLTLGAARFGGRDRGEEQGGRRTGPKSAGMPWFVVVFLGAVVFRSGAPPALIPSLDAVVAAARVGLVLTLYLIGTGLTRATLGAIGGRPFLQGMLLWAVVATVSLVAVLRWVPA
jgi:uncharacterized integral membrane protein (TIGR00698 family)